ncbi:glycerophosphoryl diester phosphodiesterase [Leucobacter exalbidus]|uniref:Glycerophosphoryl diester phosphodiesterase n=1 Tax=Leucobacter exalbidus TaxID=662960 RepID=A0A940T0W9_9MICO|nr:glycerophosphodiester phosphodiesterase family protein [Leucobacter exalbidus]MBP1326280.1 glycerophosphoryl diester phosphodiesterase [Leucobacter exalbidus]
MRRADVRQATGQFGVHLGVRSGVIAGLIAAALVIMFGANPHAAAASTMQQHGALLREGAVSIVSHRGAAALAPENTLAAVRIGIAQQVDFVEADVQLTRDGVPVLMHDLTIDRTTNGIGEVGRYTLAQLRTLDAGSWFDPAYAGEQIPTLEEFLNELAPANVRALVELKGEWLPEQISAVTDQLQARYLVNRVALQSFEEDTLRGLQQVAPTFARVMLTREWDARIAAIAVELEVSAVGGRPKVLEQHPDLLTELRAAGIGLLVYTLNKEPLWDHAMERGIDLIVTDDPVHLEEWRGAREISQAEAAAAGEGAGDGSAGGEAKRAAARPTLVARPDEV